MAEEQEKRAYLISPDGRTATVPASSVQQAIAAGFRPATQEEVETHKQKKAAATPTSPASLPKSREEEYGTIGKDTEFEKAGDFAHSLAATVEGLLGGASLDIVPFIEGGIGLGLEGLGWQDNPFTPERIELRQRANPTVHKVSEIAGAVLPALGTLGTSLLPEGAPAILKTTAGLLSEADVAGKLTQAGMRAAMPTAAKEAAARVAAGNVAGRIAGAKTGAEAAALLEKEGALVAEETTRVANEHLIRRLRNINASPGVVRRVAKAVKEGTPIGEAAVAGAKATGRKAVELGKAGAIGAGVGAGTTAVARGFEKASELQRENVPLLSEDFASQFNKATLEGAEQGAVIGGALSVGTPLAAKGLSLAIKGTNEALQGLAGKVLPKLGSIFTNIKPEQIETAMQAQRESVAANVPEGAANLADALNDELTLTKEFIDRLKNSGYAGELPPLPQNVADFAANRRIPDRRATAFPMVKTVSDRLQDVEKKWMVRDSKGNLKFDRKALKDYIEKATPNESGVIELPQELQSFHEDVSRFREMVDEIERSTLGEHLDVMSENTYNAMMAQPTIAENAVEDIFGRYQLPPESPYELLQKGLKGREARASLVPLEEGKVANLPVGRQLEIGLGLPVAAKTLLDVGAGTAGAAGVGAVTLADVLLDPAAALKNLKAIDLVMSRSSELANKFAVNLVGGRATGAVTTGLRKGTIASKGAEISEKSAAEKKEEFDKQRKIVEKYSNVGSLSQHLDDGFSNMADFSPTMAEGAKSSSATGLQFLQSKLPKAPANWIVGREWEPNPNQISQFLRYSKYVKDPDTFYSDVETKGYVPSEGLEVLQQIYPEKLKNVQMKLWDQLSEAAVNKKSVSNKNRQIVNKILGITTDNLTPEEIKKNQDALQIQPAKAPTGRVSKNPQSEAVDDQQVKQLGK
jgi:hypothetical protein